MRGGTCPKPRPDGSKTGATGQEPEADAGRRALAAASVGASWQAEVISGLAAFLVSRAKAEAIASFAVQLQEGICPKTAAADRAAIQGPAILPTTCELLHDTDPYMTPIAWRTLKAALESDLAVLPERLLAKLGISKDQAQPLIALAEAIALIERHADPLETLVGLRDKYAAINSVVLCKGNPYACSLRSIGIMTELLAPWDGSTSGADLQIALRLLYEAAKQEPLLPGDLLERFETYKPVLHALHNLLADVRGRAHDAAAAEPATSKALAAFSAYARALGEVIGRMPASALLPVSLEPSTQAQVHEMLEHLASSLDHIRAKEYVEAFVELRVALSAAGFQMPDWLVKYGGFMTEVAAVRRQEDMQRVIEAAAAPVGSWRYKRGTAHHAVTINGYVGLQGGYEWLGGADSPSGGALHGGLFAPIGLEASWGFGKRWSLGLLLSALDLGAVLDVRESTSGMTSAGAAEVDTSPNLGFRQIFSPGAYGVLGIGRGRDGLPLTLGFGFSLAPELRSIDLEGGTTRDANALRVSAFLAIDITIFKLM